ncbi:hypothetical protein N9224_01325 [Akkermansiaceae bacterium]|nr:hypothetical protein [Akkermansiaceae bacterium]
MWDRLSKLLRGDSSDLREWLENPSSRNLVICMITIILGFGSYGLTVGLWRAPLMGGFVVIKMPALIFITLACNGFLNGMLGLLLGSGLGFRQSILAQLLSFAVAAMILGSLSPILFFMALNAPAPDAANADLAHSNYLVIHTVLIAYAGVIANVHLARLLLAMTPNRRTAAMTLGAWLAGNAFVGAQFSWILRPFFGTPSLEVAFLREDAIRGTFYETVWNSLDRISGGMPIIALFVLGIGLFILLSPLFKIFSNLNSTQSTQQNSHDH